ncbi:MAG: DUF1848 family protein [Deltaproteobacteria bacterium]|nr:DUF1848 family protein [Deltaproteobacteria bacterium]
MNKIVISASRRTDIPAFYMDWFIKRIKMGYFETTNPYNMTTRKIPAVPSKVHTIIFWSKNFSYFLKKDFGEKLKNLGYNLFFNFTLNSESKILEPNMPPLSERINQLKKICLRFGSETVAWRFDPICFYKDKNNKIWNNLNDFAHIAETAYQLKIKRCVTSFADIYSKVKKRASALQDFSFIETPLKKKKKILIRMKKYLYPKNISLCICCEKEILNNLPKACGIKSASCVDAKLLSDLYGKDISLKKDAGQRVKAGCGCSISYDIGSYKMHPCFNNCLYCYANATNKNQALKRK